MEPAKAVKSSVSGNASLNTDPIARSSTNKLYGLQELWSHLYAQSVYLIHISLAKQFTYRAGFGFAHMDTLVPVFPFIPSLAVLRWVIMAVRPFLLSAKSMAASTFGSIGPAAK